MTTRHGTFSFVGTPTPRPRRCAGRRAWAAGLVVVLVSAACADGDDDGTTTGQEDADRSEPTLPADFADHVDDPLWALVDQGATRSEATLQLLREQLSSGIDIELTELLIEADLAIESGTPEADELQALIAGLFPPRDDLDDVGSESEGLVIGATLAGVPVVAAAPSDERCRQLWSNGGSDLFATADGEEATACIEEVDHIRSGSVSIELVAPRGFRATRYRQVAPGAFRSAAGRLGALGALPTSISVLYDPRPIYTSNGKDTLGTARNLRAQNGCDVVLPSTADSLTREEYGFLVEHEMAHCFQYANLDSEMRRPGGSSKWWYEGGADFLAYLAHGASLADTGSPVDRPMTRQVYDTWQFWHLTAEADASAAVRLWKSLPSSAAADPAWIDDTALHDFVTAASLAGTALGTQYLPDETTVRPDTALPGSVTLEPASSALVRIQPAGRVVDGATMPIRIVIDHDGPARLSWFRGDGSTQRAEARTDLGCRDPVDRLLVSTTAEDSIRIGFSVLDPDDFDDCDQRITCRRIASLAPAGTVEPASDDRVAAETRHPPWDSTCYFAWTDFPTRHECFDLLGPEIRQFDGLVVEVTEWPGVPPDELQELMHADAAASIDQSSTHYGDLWELSDTQIGPLRSITWFTPYELPDSPGFSIEGFEEDLDHLRSAEIWAAAAGHVITVSTIRETDSFVFVEQRSSYPEPEPIEYSEYEQCLIDRSAITSAVQVLDEQFDDGSFYYHRSGKSVARGLPSWDDQHRIALTVANELVDLLERDETGTLLDIDD